MKPMRKRLLTCLIIDEDPSAREVLEHHIDQCSDLKLIAQCEDVIHALAHLQSDPPDLLFLNLNQPEHPGVGLLKSIANLPTIILTTAGQREVVEGCTLDIADYLLKPFPMEQFEAVMDNVRAGLN
jgi:response regulator of citrate/malate metabolism